MEGAAMTNTEREMIGDFLDVLFHTVEPYETMVRRMYRFMQEAEARALRITREKLLATGDYDLFLDWMSGQIEMRKGEEDSQ
jgi:hypothetical protein